MSQRSSATTEYNRGPRMYIETRGSIWRIHHGALGALLIGVGVFGVLLVLHDWRDRPWRFNELRHHHEVDARRRGTC